MVENKRVPPIDTVPVHQKPEEMFDAQNCLNYQICNSQVMSVCQDGEQSPFQTFLYLFYQRDKVLMRGKIKFHFNNKILVLNMEGLSVSLTKRHILLTWFNSEFTESCILNMRSLHPWGC